MSNRFLYLVSVLIWGTTWFAIKFQVTTVAPDLSVAYRFTIASFILFGYCVFRKHRLRFSPREHLSMAVLGVLLFSLAYAFNYYGARHLTTGLMAVIFSMVVVMNIINSRILLKHPIQPLVVVGSLLGLLGIALVFWEDLSLAGNRASTLIGLAWVLTATYFGSLGNIWSSRIQSEGLPIAQTNAFAMLYGAGATYLFALLKGEVFLIDLSFSYLFPLFYLAFFGSVITFGCFLKLVGRIGPARASYMAVLIPIVALVVSTLFEGYRWTVPAGIGVVLILTGNLFVLEIKRFKQEGDLENRKEMKAA